MELNLNHKQENIETTIKEMQDALDETYEIELDKEYLKSIFNENTIDKISAPHLIKIHKNYIDSNKKILFVGKETNKWWGKLNHFIDIPNSIDILKQRYKVEFFGGEVQTSQNKDINKYYKAENNWNNPLFVEFKKVRKALLEDKKGSLVWINLLKMDSDTKKDYSKNSINNSNIVQVSKKIFLKEFEILQPDIMIFATSYTYDKVIKEFFGNRITESEVIEPKSLWKFKIDNTICYRTWHPSTIKYQAKKTKFEYYEDIINDTINNEKLNS